MSWLTPLARRSIPLGFLGTIVLIFASESFIARHDLRFSAMEADTWKAARVAAENIQAGGILTFGDSQVELGISPLSVESHLGQPVQCMAVPGGQPPSSYFLLRSALEAGTIPSAIVVDFEPQLLQRDRGPSVRMWPEFATLGECFEFAKALGDPGAFAGMAISELLPSHRQRLEIRKNLMAGFRGETPINPSFMSTIRRNRGMNRGALMLGKQPPGKQHSLDEWITPAQYHWNANPVNEIYAHKFLKLAQQHNIPVFLALMPVVPALKQKTFEIGLETKYFNWIRKLQKKYPNLYVLDWRNANYPDAVFSDALHLDYEGAASVGIALAEYLKGCMRGEGIGVRWVRMPPFQVDGSQVALEDHNRSEFVVKSVPIGTLRR